MAAGTIVRPLATATASYALPITNWCRVDTSGESLSTSVLRCASALARSYIRPTNDLHDQAHDDRRSMFHHRPQSVSTTSCRGTEGHSAIYGVRPQQVET